MTEYHKRKYIYDAYDEKSKGMHIDKKKLLKAKSKIKELAGKEGICILNNDAEINYGAGVRSDRVYLFCGGAVVDTYESHQENLLSITHPTQKGVDEIARRLELPVSQEENNARSLEERCYIKGLGKVSGLEGSRSADFCCGFSDAYASFKTAGKRILPVRDIALMILNRKIYEEYSNVAESVLYIPGGDSLLISDAMAHSSWEQAGSFYKSENKFNEYHPPKSLIEKWQSQAERDKKKDLGERKALILAEDMLGEEGVITLERAYTNEIVQWLFERNGEKRHKGLVKRFFDSIVSELERENEESSKEILENKIVLDFSLLHYTRRKQYEKILHLNNHFSGDEYSTIGTHTSDYILFGA